MPLTCLNLLTDLKGETAKPRTLPSWLNLQRGKPLLIAAPQCMLVRKSTLLSKRFHMFGQIGSKWSVP